MCRVSTTCPFCYVQGQYYPSFLLCPEAYTWVPIERCVPKLDASPYARLEEPGKGDMHVMCGCMCMYVEEVGAGKRGTECESDGGKDREHFLHTYFECSFLSQCVK